MKKYYGILLIIFSLFLWGCTDSNNNYQNYIHELSNVNESSNNLPFDIKITIEKLTDNDLMYQVIIDNPDYLLYNVKAIIIHDISVEDIFPSLGIVDEPINLSKTTKNDFSKGIILTGYLPYQEEYSINFKVLVQYTLNNQIDTKYYITNVTNSNNQ